MVGRGRISTRRAAGAVGGFAWIAVAGVLLAAPMGAAGPRDDLATRVAVIETRMDAAAMALDSQAREYERRLTILNGEAERLRLMQATYMPRELHDSQIGAIATELVELREFKASYQGRQAVLSAVVAVGVSLIFLFFGAWMQSRGATRRYEGRYEDE